MKKWWVVVFALAFVVSITTPVLLDAKGKEPAITKVEDYIELDANSVKFLFRTEPGTVKFYLGENPRKLAMVKQENRYDYRQGLVIDGLQPGRKYYYKVKAAQGSSPVHSFVKLGGFDADKKAEWARTSVFYFVYLRSFYDGNGDGIGDFIGLKEKLGYLKDLGIDAVWILPCFLSVGVHGYDILDYKQIRRDYGGMEAYREFLKEARKQGIKVVLDLVVNHTSYMHRWFSQAKYPDNEEYDKYRNFYVWADRFDNTNLAGPWGQKVWFNNGEDDFYAVFGSNMPDLNFRYPGVREEIKKVAEFWLDPNGDGDFSDGVDGFRLDAAKHIDDKMPEVTHSWWKEFTTHVKSINPNAFIVGECWTSSSEVAKYMGDMDSAFNFDLAAHIVNFAKGLPFDLVTNINMMYTQYRKYSPNFIDSTFLSNHDMNRVASELDGDPGKIRLATAVFLTLPGTPFIYYGNELGQLGAKPDPNIREPLDWYASAEGPGMPNPRKWGGSMVNCRPHDGISVEEQQKDPNSLLNLHKKLIKIRKAHPIMFYGNYTKVETPSGIYGYEITGNVKYKLLVIHNQKDQARKIKVPVGGKELLHGVDTQQGEVELKPYGTLIIKYNK